MKSLLFLLLITFLSFSSCSKDESISEAPKAPIQEINEIQKNSPYVILVSFDGYRFDYTKKYKPSNIRSFIKGGVEAEGIIPIYPSLTFPKLTSCPSAG